MIGRYFSEIMKEREDINTPDLNTNRKLMSKKLCNFFGIENLSDLRQLQKEELLALLYKSTCISYYISHSTKKRLKKEEKHNMELIEEEFGDVLEMIRDKDGNFDGTYIFYYAGFSDAIRLAIGFEIDPDSGFDDDDDDGADVE